jgi:hypothetical protein
MVAVVALIAAGTALWFALTGPAGRAGAVAGALAATASTLAALAAIYLSREALARTDQQLAMSREALARTDLQLELARRAVVLSRYPLLLPIHESVTFPDFSGSLAAHPPTEDRFRLNSAAAGSYAFVTDKPDTFMIPVQNAGEGPALRIGGRLWRSDGRAGDVLGPSALGTAGVAIMTSRLQDTADPLPNAFEEAIKVAGDQATSGYFWLDLHYFDVFGHPQRSCALFDPRGLGIWRHSQEPAIETSAEGRWADRV